MKGGREREGGSRARGEQERWERADGAGVDNGEKIGAAGQGEKREEERGNLDEQGRKRATGECEADGGTMEVAVHAEWDERGARATDGGSGWRTKLRGVRGGEGDAKRKTVG